MHNKNTVKHSFITMLLVVVFAFSLPVNLLAKNSEKTDETSGVIGNLQTYTADSSVQNNVIPLQTNTSAVKDNVYIEEEKMPGNDTAVSPDDVIPDINTDDVVDADDGYKEQNGVTVIPAVLNNFMRDSLSSIVSKKVYTFTVDKRGVIWKIRRKAVCGISLFMRNIHPTARVKPLITEL